MRSDGWPRLLAVDTMCLQIDASRHSQVQGVSGMLQSDERAL